MPKKSKWTLKSLEKVFSKAIIRNIEKGCRDPFPSYLILKVSDTLPNSQTVKNVTGIKLVEFYQHLYQRGLIPIEYNRKINFNDNIKF